MYSKFAGIFNSFDSILQLVGYSSIPSLEMSCLLGESPCIRPRRSTSVGPALNDGIIRLLTALSDDVLQSVELIR
jgi:hypothetical protein